MTAASDALLSRPIAVADVPAAGLEVTVEASEAERAELARRFGTGPIDRLVGSFSLTGTSERIHVTGIVEAGLIQTCVVTLEPFATNMREEVDVTFMSTPALERWRAAFEEPEAGETPAEDEPDEIVGGAVDLGAVTAEFFALGLDPYPRKPGAQFQYEGGDDGKTSPFAVLKNLPRREGQ
ncbi:Uncharacterized ACR, COG1399 [Chelatococcus sambhunathii]|uniref:Uncharacterized ACR, COG1399 n=1 Tax=Chelatococcus sambhunathii TaxID=363953 RepID=A0ABM9U9X1_9HYPH|nr:MULTISPECIES: DUF177 domain-containing protein [Chelatococcus]CUA90140.1 Uncharacterized ACR, COG1399 [Chelatococcus sambhunathii]